MIMMSPLANCGFMPPQALLTISTLAAQRLHHADRERDLLERVAFVEVEPPFHGHDGLAGKLAADQPARVRRGRSIAGKCGMSRVGKRRLGGDLLGQAAQAGAEDDADGRLALQRPAIDDSPFCIWSNISDIL